MPSARVGAGLAHLQHAQADHQAAQRNAIPTNKAISLPAGGRVTRTPPSAAGRCRITTCSGICIPRCLAHSMIRCGDEAAGHLFAQDLVLLLQRQLRLEIIARGNWSAPAAPRARRSR